MRAFEQNLWEGRAELLLLLKLGWLWKTLLFLLLSYVTWGGIWPCQLSKCIKTAFPTSHLSLAATEFPPKANMFETLVGVTRPKNLFTGTLPFPASDPLIVSNLLLDHALLWEILGKPFKEIFGGFFCQKGTSPNFLVIITQAESWSVQEKRNCDRSPCWMKIARRRVLARRGMLIF